MRRDVVELAAPSMGGSGGVIAYGHYGQPVLVFPSEAGRCYDYENNGMVGAVAGLIDAGRVKLYCVDSYDEGSWANWSLPLEERARRHSAYEAWITEVVVAFIAADCQGARDIVTTGCSLGAYHAANLTLKRADLFSRSLCLSGSYDISRSGWGERGDATYFSNPMDYIAHADGDHLDWLRSRVWLLLVCGQGMWEDTTGSLDSTRAFAARLAAKGIPHEMDLWGYDVPHDWPSWRAQLAHHLPRFC